jgi:UDPglucose 6-dehydrogenase
MGTGYVGLVTGACLASAGNTVTCVDIDEEKIAMLNRGESPIYEAGLEDLLERHHNENRLFFTTEAGPAIANAEIVFIAVGTPSDTDGSADLRYVLQVSETIAENMEGYTVVICKSTVPVGTCDKVRDKIAGLTDEAFDVVSNPEFLKEGTAVSDFMSPARVIIGSDSDRAANMVSELYAPFMRRRERIVRMDVRSAEMTKYASNAMLATKISFMNEIANLCDSVGANVERVRVGMSFDERVGPHFIFPGIGYGGSCFPKDVRALERLGAEHGAATRMLSAVHNVNESQKLRLVAHAHDHFGDDLEGKTFAIWGLSFKPKTDDVREAPSLQTIAALVDQGATIRAHDPAARDTAATALKGMVDSVEFCSDEYETLRGCDALFIHTEWSIYRSPDFDRIAELLSEPVIFDGRNLYEPERMEERGFTYRSIGRPS